MCILFIAVEQHPNYPLIIAANRDEFHERPTRRSDFWEQNPNILAGKDMQAGGTWMGVSTTGRLSALTNVRDPQKLLANPNSRGELVFNYLNSSISNEDYLSELKSTRHIYNGYNLLFGAWDNLWVYNNHTNDTTNLIPGVYGLSNADLNSPWPKINDGVKNLKAYCQQSGQLSTDKLFQLLLNQTQSSDEFLPRTGVPIEWERKLSSIFIKSAEYGTRSSTILMINDQNQVIWQEHSFNSQADLINEVEHCFSIQ